MIGSFLRRLNGAARNSSGFREAVKRGNEARNARNWELAAQYYSSAVGINPSAAEIHVQLGHSLKESSNLAAAEAAYLRALELNPDDADVRVQLGHLYKMRGDIVAALRYYRSAQARGSRDPHMLSYLATPRYIELAKPPENGYPVFGFQIVSISRPQQNEDDAVIFDMSVELDRITKEELFYLIEKQGFRFGCQVYSGSSDTDVIASDRGEVIDNVASPSSLTVRFTLPATVFLDEKIRLISVNGVYDGKFWFTERPSTYAAIGLSKREKPDLFRYYLEKFNADRQVG